MLKEIIQSVNQPNELGAMIKLKLKMPSIVDEGNLVLESPDRITDLQFCYNILDKVSRSFSTVIRHLPNELTNVVCVFYLSLRALDTIEDDMSLDSKMKTSLLRNFHQNNNCSNWSVTGIGDNQNYQLLLENYGRVASVFQGLDLKYQKIITEICKEMGEGMALYIERDIKTIAEYDEYCHYVAGVVGIGLSKLFSQSKLESTALEDSLEMANYMGLFLQKTNIIRDYHEDVKEDRIFWPEQAWKKYAINFKDFLYKPESREALSCLNSMVTDALSHAIACLEYLKMIENPKIFRFCAIPQVMAIATLAKIYNNPLVFQTNVKIRKGLAAKLFMNINNYSDARLFFKEMAGEIFQKITLEDPNSALTVKYLHQIAMF